MMNKTNDLSTEKGLVEQRDKYLTKSYRVLSSEVSQYI